MKFNQKFVAKYKIKNIIEENVLMIEILDTGTFSCEVKKCCLHGFFGRVYEGDVYSSECVFLESEKNGYYMKSLGVPVLEIPSSEEELIKYSASQINGVSKTTMERVVNYFGIDFISIINDDPNEINKLQLKETQKQSIVDWCESHYNLDSIASEAYLYGISPVEIFDIYKKYGSRTIKIIEKNPYVLYLYGLISFRKIDKIALKNKIDQDSVERVAAIIYNFISDKEESGSMAAYEMEIMAELEKQKLQHMFVDAIKYLAELNFIEKAVFGEETFYGKVENISAEKIIANYLTKNINAQGYSTEVIEMAFKGNELNKQQKEAVFGCLSHKISLLTGGPGTGKTFTIKRIIRTVKNIDPSIRISLMAPTGKAASRMIEMIGMEAKTIHCSFGIAECDDILRKDGMKLESDLIIIDESSMIDEKLFSYVCRHVAPHTQLILVGDTGQLPSVAAGNLLYSLSKIVPNYELTTICRQDKTSAIVLNAHRIRNNKIDEIEFDDDEFKFIETNNVTETVCELYHELSDIYFPEEIMILSPQHNKNGTDSINAKIQEENPGKILKQYCRDIYKESDRVIQTKNDKKLQIHNGDQGFVIGLAEKGLWVLFDGSDEPVEITDLSNLELAYSITVHKSQGSESEIVIMVFNEAHLFTLSDKLIYTALTRTKKKFIGVGNKNVFFQGCKKEEKLRISLINYYFDAYNKLAL